MHVCGMYPVINRLLNIWLFDVFSFANYNQTVIKCTYEKKYRHEWSEYLLLRHCISLLICFQNVIKWWLVIWLPAVFVNKSNLFLFIIQSKATAYFYIVDINTRNTPQLIKSCNNQKKKHLIRLQCFSEAVLKNHLNCSQFSCSVPRFKWIVLLFKFTYDSLNSICSWIIEKDLLSWYLHRWNNT